MSKGLSCCLVILLFVPITFIGAVVILLGGAPNMGGGGSGPQAHGAALKKGKVPSQYVPMINKAIEQCDQKELTAPIIAAQISQESNFNPQAESGVGAKGIAQFMPGTWPSWATDGNNNGNTSPWEPADGIAAQGNFMCSLVKKAKSSGIQGKPIELALAGYNAGFGAVQKYNGIPSGGGYNETAEYVPKITNKAKQFADPTGNKITTSGGGSAAVNTAIDWAKKQLGTPYYWGGTCTDPGPEYNNTNCDCSSLMQQAYKHAGVTLPRTTKQQINAGKPVTSPSEVKRGDLVLPDSGHVGMYLGNNKIIQAPQTGDVVKISEANPNDPNDYWFGDPYGIRRVANQESGNEHPQNA